ncbi:MAG: hypothetical protein J7494_14285 [Sphingobium sp.]|nr:hypothetical protein [Sphingobium sp.]
MIPTRHSYYRRRAQEHRVLARAASLPEIRAMHDRLVEAYTGLTRLHRPRRQLRLKPAIS